MVSAKTLIKMARKWRKMAALGRKRISSPRTNGGACTDSCSTSSVAEKGHFVAYTSDRKRFVIPLEYLSNAIFGELLRMSEEEFGLSRDGPILIPCDSVLLEYLCSLVHRGLGRDVEQALLNSIATSSYSLSNSFSQSHTNQKLLVCV